MTIKEQTMREAGAKLSLIFSYIIPTIIPGTKLSNVNKDVEGLLNYFDSRSALKMMGFPGSISICLNDQVLQGIPDDRMVRAGDLVSLDMTLYYKGFFVDKAVSFVIDPPNQVKSYLVNAVNKCLETAIMNTRGGVETRQIGAAITQQARILGIHVGKEFYGHTIGENHHMKPLIPNYDDGSSNKIRVGEFVSLEPIVFYDFYLLKQDGHQIGSSVLSAHAEETVYITDDGAEVIT